jgi:hypothetical protein
VKKAVKTDQGDERPCFSKSHCQIKATNAHASRNLIALRQDLVQSNTSVDSFTAPSSGGGDRARVHPIANSVPEGKATTKGKLLRSQVESLKIFLKILQNQQ